MNIYMHFLQDHYGIDWDGPVSITSDTDRVEVPGTATPITPEQLCELKAAVDPLEQCESLGVSLYLVARAFVGACTC